MGCCTSSSAAQSPHEIAAKRQAAKIKEHGDIPMETKAIAQLTDTPGGPDTNFNPKLKMLLMSSGLFPSSTECQKKAYKSMYDATSGKGILYLMDAKVPCHQFWELKADPEKCNNEAAVAYQRQPDEPGGFPVRDDKGNLLMKTQGMLAEINGGFFCNPPYFTRHKSQFSNGHLGVLCGDDNDVPIYFAYHMYQGDFVDDKPDAKIYIGQGVWKDGQFHAKKTDGELFKESDYEEEWAQYVEEKETPFFKQSSAEDFAKVVASVKTIWSCGGNPFLPVVSLMPDYQTSDGKKTEHPNLYGRAVLDAVKAGEVIYVGMSAGSVCMSFGLGPLTADAAVFEIEEHDRVHRKLDLSQKGILGERWLFPNLGSYIGMPYRLLWRPHVKVDFKTLSFGSSDAGAHRVDEVMDQSDHACEKDCFAVLLQDYDYEAGVGDAVQICDQKLFYLTGKCDVTGVIPEDSKPELKKVLPNWVDENPEVRVQPPSVPAEGLIIEWDPSKGELLASGPEAKTPFHLHITDKGPMKDAPPY